MKTFRFMVAALMMAPLFGGVAHATPNYQDAWWDPAQSGMGVMILHQNDIVAAAWYFFGADGKATYLLLSGPLSGNSVSGNLRRATGPQPGPGFSPALVSESAAGTATLTFNSSTTATLSYSFDGLSGSLSLVRMSIAQPNFNGSVTYGAQSTRSQCANLSNNASGVDLGHLTIVRTSDAVTVTKDSINGLSCTFSTTLAQSGSVYSASGTFSCGGGQYAGTASFTDLRLTDDLLTANYTLTYTTGETCRESGKIAGTMAH